MPRVTLNNGIELEYETIGSPTDPPLLLVMGFTAQLISWPDGFCQALADHGHYVIRFDNRDSGLSTKLHGASVDLTAVITAALARQEIPDVPYTLSDFAQDSLGLLDHLGIDAAHVVGASMGGMIVQTMAIESPERVRSMTSIMSMPGDPEYGKPAPEAIGQLLTPPPTERDAYLQHALGYQLWESKKYRDPKRTQEQAARSYDRSFYPEGGSRQLAAIYASGDRSDGLGALRGVPSLVIHGRDDTLITPSGGIRTAELIDGAHLLLLADMGHDLPEPLWPTLVDAIASLTANAESYR
jgi:pimeloyl-ACP methyl ester carboxylesterase